MVVFKYTFTSASSSLSAFEEEGVATHRGPFPRRSPLDEAPAAAACVGMGWVGAHRRLQCSCSETPTVEHFCGSSTQTYMAKFSIQDYIRMMLENNNHAYLDERTQRVCGTQWSLAGASVPQRPRLPTDQAASTVR
jgi:hypothetical protein